MNLEGIIFKELTICFDIHAFKACIGPFASSLWISFFDISIWLSFLLFISSMIYFFICKFFYIY